MKSRDTTHRFFAYLVGYSSLVPVGILSPGTSCLARDHILHVVISCLAQNTYVIMVCLHHIHS